MKYGLNYSELKVVEKALQSHSEVEEAVLFGSRVIGSFKEASDVDIALKGKKANTTLVARLKSYFEEETNLPYFFDFLSYSHINNKNLKNHIDKDGVVIYRKGWQKIKLGDAVQLLKETWKVGDKTFPYIGLEHIEENSLRLNSHSDSNSITSNKYRFYSGNTLFGKLRPYFRKVVKPKFDGICSTDIWVITPKEGYNEDFIFYFFANQKLVNLANSSSKGTRMPRADWNFISETIWDFPPLQEQEAIAEVLSSLDDKIELLHKQNKTLEDIAQTLFHKWFIQDVKDDWEKGKLGDFLETIESGSRPKGGIDSNLKEGIPSIGAESINGIGNFDFSKTKYISDDFFKNLKRGIIKNYDVLIYKIGAGFGKKAMFGQGFPFQKMSINENVLILRSNSKTNQFFIYFLLNQKELIKLNTYSAQPGLDQKAMKSFKIIMPPKTKMDEFENITRPWIEKVLFNSNQIRELEKTRSILLPKLINGEIEVKYYE